jgi:hypothetical protein
MRRATSFFSKSKEASMLKKFMVTTAITGLMIGVAAAQTSQPSGSQMPSAQEKPATAAPSGSAPAGKTQFINSQSADQWLSANFIGTDVVGPDDAKIGDVNNVLFTKDGKVVAYVVGVGGFLGLGAKNVALAPESFQMMPAGSSTTGSASTSDDIKLKLNMTKDQLQQAASFESKKDQDSKARASSPSSSPGSRPAGSGSAPK